MTAYASQAAMEHSILAAPVRVPEVVARGEIPAIHSVIEGGREHVLGILKEFRRHERLSGFLPHDYRVAMAWVHLDAGQTLEPHVHPVDSMILITRGAVRALGDREADLAEGDILMVPHGCRHGFTGMGHDGFWGISVQFNSRGLYEDLQDPWASFVADGDGLGVKSPSDGLGLLLSENDRYVENFAKHRLFSLAREGFFEGQRRERFFDCFQIWSNHFQRMLQLRAGLAEPGAFGDLANRHLQEEQGHHQLLAASRTRAREIWDPPLEASCAWFPWKMTTVGDAERVVLVHLVVEASADVFYREMSTVMSGSEASSHLDAHSGGTDSRHLAMGLQVLQEGSLPSHDRLLSAQKQGWQMLGTIFGRMVDLVSGAS